MDFHPLTEAEQTALLPYKGALPEREYAALAAWFTTFWPFQREWMLDSARYALCNKSRQIGISHSTAGLLDLWGIFHGETTTVISVGERESVEVLDKCRKHSDVLQAIGSTMAERRGKDNATEIRFASGGRVIALPSSGGRSFTGNVYLDEFAYYENRRSVWDAAMAITLLGFRARISSTPNGVGNEFHELVTEPTVGRGWSKHEIPISRAIDDGYPVDIDDCWLLAKHDPRLFDQLFNCKFLDNELQYIPTELIDACSCGRQGLTEGAGDCFAGLDVGKEVDRTVLCVVRRTVSHCAVIYIETQKRTDSDELEAMVTRAMKAFAIKKLAVDATGIGAFPAERMQKQFGFYKVEPVKFTLQGKEDLATRLYSAFAERTVRIPMNDAAFPEKPKELPGWLPDTAKQMKLDVCAIRREVTTAGNVRYDAPHTDKGHADSAWALALALYAASGAQPRGHVKESLAAAL